MKDLLIKDFVDKTDHSNYQTTTKKRILSRMGSLKSEQNRCERYSSLERKKELLLPNAILKAPFAPIYIFEVYLYFERLSISLIEGERSDSSTWFSKPISELNFLAVDLNRAKEKLKIELKSISCTTIFMNPN